jgi:GTP-binding protein
VIEASFVLSASAISDLPGEGLAELALVGRSNVGKSTLINALVGRRLARTSGAPGKTRLANVYRVRRDRRSAFYLIDLPGYGFARGDREELAAVTEHYFAADRDRAALLLVDARHPGLQNDREAWRWLRSTVDRAAIVATKIDKLSRAERLRAIATYEAVFQHPVLPISAETGEGLDQLWTQIDRLLNSSSPRPRRSPKPGPSPMAAPDPPRRPPKNSSSRR